MSGKVGELEPYALDVDVDDCDADYFLEVTLLNIEIKELIQYELKDGDVDLETKARRVLEVGAKHIVEGRPSSEFLKFIADSITNTLNGEESSLDSAFRLSKRSHRPKKDPYADAAVIAYSGAIQSYYLISPEDVSTETAKRDAIDLAYLARYRASAKAHRESGIYSETIRSRKRTIKETLVLLGIY